MNTISESSLSPPRLKQKAFSEIKDFDLLACIGSGAFGKVYNAKDNINKMEFALKIIDKVHLSSKGLSSVLCEAKTLASLNHKNIVQFYQLNENKESILIFMELIRNGSLFELIERKRNENIHFSDEEVSKMIGSLLSAISYIHQKNIVHRDIKPRNILVCNPEDLSSIKLIDFGLSCHFNDYFIKVFSQKCGTLLYMSPELIKGELYSKPVDIWSTGIIMMELLNYGKHPFDDEELNTKKLIIERIVHPKWDLAKDFFIKLTNDDPQARYTADQALLHPWITRKFHEEIPLTFSEKMRIINLQTDLSNKIMVIFFIQILLNKEKNNYSRTKTIKKTPENHLENIDGENNKKSLLRISKTMEISEEVDNDNSFTTRKDITLIDAIFKDDSNLASPSKNFRIKNSFMKPLFLLTNNPSPINHAQILANSKNCEKNELIQPQNFKKNVCTSPKNISISPKSFHCQMKKPKFPDIIEPGNFSYLLMETDLNKTNVSSKLQYHNSNTPKSRNSKINSEKEEKEKFSPSKIERSYIIKKKIAGVSPPSKKSSETKKMENIKLDKETLRDLNRFTDKNFIKSIKASFRKLEIIEKINEDNFKNEKSNTFTEKTIVKRNLSTNISISDRNLLCETSKLPLISPDYSPRKRNLTFKNSKIPKI